MPMQVDDLLFYAACGVILGGRIVETGLSGASRPDCAITELKGPDLAELNAKIPPAASSGNMTVTPTRSKTHSISNLAGAERSNGDSAACPCELRSLRLRLRFWGARVRGASLAGGEVVLSAEAPNCRYAITKSAHGWSSVSVSWACSFFRSRSLRLIRGFPSNVMLRSAPVTVRHLLAHTSGIPSSGGKYVRYEVGGKTLSVPQQVHPALRILVGAGRGLRHMVRKALSEGTVVAVRPAGT